LSQVLNGMFVEPSAFMMKLASKFHGMMFLTALAMVSGLASARADEPVHVTGSAAVAAGSGGAGGQVGFTYRRENLGDYFNTQDLRANGSIGVVSSGTGKFAPVGNIGWIYRMTPNMQKGDTRFGFMILSDPMLVHSDGVRGILGGDPLAGVGGLLTGKHFQISLSPKIFGILDHKSGQTAVGVGGQTTLELEMTDKLKGSAFAIAATATQDNSAPGTKGGARYLAAGAGLQYFLLPDVALNGSMEISDFCGVKTTDAQPAFGSAILTTFGVTKVIK
jgi:hypothetical protein